MKCIKEVCIVPKKYKASKSYLYYLLKQPAIHYLLKQQFGEISPRIGFDARKS